jgi:hypothetical protein
MRENIVVICPTPQARTHAADWHDGQFAHANYAGLARRAIGRFRRAGTLAETAVHIREMHRSR